MYDIENLTMKIGKILYIGTIQSDLGCLGCVRPLSWISENHTAFLRKLICPHRLPAAFVLKERKGKKSPVEVGEGRLIILGIFIGLIRLNQKI